MHECSKDSKQVQGQRLRSMKASAAVDNPERSCFPFKSECSLNAESRQGLSKKCKQHRNTIISFSHCCFPLLTTYAENNDIDGKEKTE